MSRGPDAGTLLERAIDRSARTAACPVAILAADWTRWASATFLGARHALTLRAVASPDFERWLTALPEAELALRGHLVADLRIISVARQSGDVVVELEILTVEE